MSQRGTGFYTTKIAKATITRSQDKWRFLDSDNPVGVLTLFLQIENALIVTWKYSQSQAKDLIEKRFDDVFVFKERGYDVPHSTYLIANKIFLAGLDPTSEEAFELRRHTKAVVNGVKQGSLAFLS